MGAMQRLREFSANLPKGRALLTFIATFIVVCTISILCYRLTLEVIDAGEWVAHTHRVLNEVHESISAVREMEGAQRGYIITGMEEFQHSYDASVEKMRNHLDNLANSVIDDEIQKQRLPKLRTLFEDRIAQAQIAVEQRRTQGFDAAQKQVAQNQGSKITAKIQALLDAMEDKENELLAARYEKLTQSTEVTISALAILGALATTLLCLSFYSTNLYIMERRRSEEETKRYAAELSSAKSRLDAILASMGDGLYQIDPAGKIVFINPACEAITGYKQQELLGRDLRDFIAGPSNSLASSPAGGSTNHGYDGSHSHGHEDDHGRLVPLRADEYCGLFSVMENGTTYEALEQIFIGKNGKRVPVHYVSSPLTRDGIVVGAVITFRDVTMRKEAERRVAEFYSMVSHELRSPLTSIRGALGLMEGGKAGELAAKAKRLIGIAREECDRLIRLINDILDMRKIEAGKLTMTRKYENLAEVIRATIDGIKPMATESGVRLELEPVDNQITIYCDRDRMVQVVNNLIGNAVKFSPEGECVTVRGTRVEREGRVMARVEVSDRGPGIGEEDKDKLFNLFQQLDSSDSRPKGGTGLGLAISKALVEQHGGKIGFDSVVGQGSTFWFEVDELAMNEKLEDKIARLSARFTRDLPEKIERISACIKAYEANPEEGAEQLAEARADAHKLSGSAGSYGFDELGNIMLSIEKKFEALTEVYDPRVLKELRADLEQSRGFMNR
jgi:PAS domain S-box-containing protein